MQKTYKVFTYGLFADVDITLDTLPNAKFIGRGMLPDYEVIFADSGLLSARYKRGKAAYGLIWELGTVDKSNLDLIEGIPISYREERVYVKKFNFLPDKELIKCSIYLKNTIDEPKRVKHNTVIFYIQNFIRNGSPVSYYSQFYKYL